MDPLVKRRERLLQLERELYSTPAIDQEINSEIIVALMTAEEIEAYIELFTKQLNDRRTY